MSAETNNGNNDNNNNNNDVTDLIATGTIVRIHSLQSSLGQELNGRRAIVIQKVETNNTADDKESNQQDPEEVRFQVKIEMLDKDSIAMGTKAIKRTNLSPIPKLPLPDPSNYNRGFVFAPDDNMSRTICELLLCEHDGYTPPYCELRGYAAMALTTLLPHSYLMHFTAIQMEQFAAVLCLTNICKQGEIGCCDVLIALLEGNPIYIITLLHTLYATPFIGKENDKPEQDEETYDAVMMGEHIVTPDQTGFMYIKAIQHGPLGLLREMCRHPLEFSRPLFDVIKNTPYYHLMVQRLFRLIARESLGEPDGETLGPDARTVLSIGILDETETTTTTTMAPIMTKVPIDTANYILSQSSCVLTSPETTTKENILKLLNFEGETTTESTIK